MLLPTGEVMAFSGADIDEVDAPALGRPVREAELFDPVTKSWKVMATATRPRTYHNTATLLPDGRVLARRARADLDAVPVEHPHPGREPEPGP